MTKYRCGHKSDTIIMGNTVLGMSEYVEWMNTTGFNGNKSECFDCYLEPRKPPTKQEKVNHIRDTTKKVTKQEGK